MRFIAKQKYTYYLRFRVDLWGLLKNTLQICEDNTIYKSRWLNKSKQNYLYNKKYKIYTSLYINLKKAGYKKKIKKYKYYLLRMINIWISKYNIHEFLKITVPTKISKLLCRVVNLSPKKPKIFFRIPFIYDARVNKGFKKKKRADRELLGLRLTRLFFVIYKKYRQIKRIALKAKGQYGVFEHNFLTIVESKLPSYLYRTSFFSTIFESIEFVKGGNAWINKKFIPFLNYSVRVFDFVGFRVIYKSFIFWSFFKRLRRKAFLFVFSRCMFISYNFLFTILIKPFLIRDMVNAYPVDYYRLASYAQ